MSALPSVVITAVPGSDGTAPFALQPANNMRSLLLTAALADGLLLHGLQPHTQLRCEQPSIRCQLPDDTSTTPLEKDIDVSEAATALEEILQLEATATAQPNTARFFAVEHQFDREQVILPRPLEIPTPRGPRNPNTRDFEANAMPQTLALPFGRPRQRSSTRASCTPSVRMRCTRLDSAVWDTCPATAPPRSSAFGSATTSCPGRPLMTFARPSILALSGTCR